MATHSTVLAWRIPGIAETGGLTSMETQRVGHDWSGLAAAAGLHCCSGLLYFQREGATLWWQYTSFSILCFSWCRSQALWHSCSVVVAHQLSCPRAFSVFPNQVSNTYLMHWIKRDNTLEGILNKSLLHETWHHGLFRRRLIEDCPCFKQPPEIRTDWSSPPKGLYRILKLSCHVALFLLQFLNPTLDRSFQRAGLSLASLLSIRQ